jgi:pimeloyl-ACP methyl ester carboxylesterase
MRTLIAIALTFCLSNAAVAAEPATFAGSWWGLLDLGLIKLHVAFRLRQDKSGWTGDVASPDQKPGWIPLSSVTVVGDTLKIEMTPLHASYEGKRGDKDKIKGTFTQGAALPLDLVRGDVPVQRRPQQPKPPYPYASEDVTVPNSAAGLTLGCTLTHPDAPKFPAVILITGSGPQDRDETIVGHKPFLLIADALARHGIGALRCDDRGVSRSTGNFAAATTLDFAGDVAAEVAWLRARHDVDSKHIGLIGHSEGGIIAPIVASRDTGVAFLVLLAGTGLRGDEILARQAGLVARSEGADAQHATEAEAAQRRVIAVVMSTKDDAAARAKLEPMIKAQAPELNEQQLSQQLRTMLSPWMRTFFALDPQPYLQKVKVPVLALNGARDVQVPLENLQAIKQALANDADVTVKPLPGLNHLFQTCQRCSIGEYAELEETMAPSALQLMVEWVERHTR